MNGPEHYLEAERQLAHLADLMWDDAARPEIVALAQVHATLALAAAQSETMLSPPSRWRLVLEEGHR